MKCKQAYLLLQDYFGPELATDMLWNATAYPFDPGYKILSRAKALIKKASSRIKGAKKKWTRTKP